MNYQKLIVIGNVTGDAEIKQSQTGTAYARFSVAVGKDKEKTVFFPVMAFGKLGEAVAEYVTKGRQVLVEGRVVPGAQGRFSVIADSVIFGASAGKAR